jgi:preprotein translocase subunit SecD
MRALLVPALTLIALASAPGCESPSDRVSTASEDAFVVLQARTQDGAPLSGEDLDAAVSIIQRRAAALGIEVIVHPEGRDRVKIQFPVRRPTGAEVATLADSGELAFYDLETSLAGPSISVNGVPVEHASLYQVLAAVQARVRAGTSDDYYVFNAMTKELVAGPFGTEREAAKPLHAQKGRLVFAVPQGMVVVTCGTNAVFACPGANGAGVPPNRTYYYLFKYYPPNVPQMTGEDLQASGTRVDLDSITGQPIVTMEFTRSGGRTFQQITRDEWVRGQLRTAPQHFAIVVDREIKTFPQIDYLDASISGGIGGRRAEIQGLDSMREAKRIAVVLQSGALPVRLRIVKSHL